MYGSIEYRKSFNPTVFTKEIADKALDGEQLSPDVLILYIAEINHLLFLNRWNNMILI